MTPCRRSYNACLAGAFLLVVLLTVLGCWSIPQILNPGESAPIAAYVAAAVVLVVAAVIAFLLVGVLELACFLIAETCLRRRARRRAARRRGYLIGGPWS